MRASVFNVGSVSGAASLAQGDVDIAAAGAQGNAANVGVVLSAAGAATATGSMTVSGALPLAGGLLQAGQIFPSGRGSFANGEVSIGGDAGTVGGFLIVGNVTSTSDAQVGSQSSGRLEVLNGGGLTLNGGTSAYIGTVLGSGSVIDGGNTFTDSAQGRVTIDGALRVAGGDTGFVGVGFTGGGIADGGLQVGSLDMGANRIGNLQVGVSTTGQAIGSLVASGGSLNVDTLSVGNTAGGVADGHLALTGMAMNAGNVLAGNSSGGGSATARIAMNGTAATVQDSFSLFNGELALDRSLLSVGDSFRLGGGASLLLALDGLNRGSEYGAIDTLLAYLDGQLAIDFSELAFGGGSMVFDLIRADDSIIGDFASLAFIGLDSQYQALTGIVNVGDDQVYRLTLAQLGVPEPASTALLLLAVTILAAFRRPALRVRRR